MSFTNADSATVPATQYCNSFAATSRHPYISLTSNTNWGFDFWFNANSWPVTSAITTPTAWVNSAAMVCFGDEGGSNTNNRLAVQVGIFNYGSTENGLYVVNYSGAGFSCVNQSSLTLNTWYHVVYVDNNGTGQLYLNNAQQSAALTGGLNVGTGLAAINPNLNAVPTTSSLALGQRLPLL